MGLTGTYADASFTKQKLGVTFLGMIIRPVCGREEPTQTCQTLQPSVDVINAKIL